MCVCVCAFARTDPTNSSFISSTALGVQADPAMRAVVMSWKCCWRFLKHCKPSCGRANLNTSADPKVLLDLKRSVCYALQNICVYFICCRFKYITLHQRTNEGTKKETPLLHPSFKNIQSKFQVFQLTLCVRLSASILTGCHDVQEVKTAEWGQH